MNSALRQPHPVPDLPPEPPEAEVAIEVPWGGFLKRGSTGRVDFFSPLPCPFNYGPVPNLPGLAGVPPVRCSRQGCRRYGGGQAGRLRYLSSAA